MMTFHTCCVETVEVVDAKFGVGLAGTEDVVDGSQQAVRYGDGGFVAAATSGDSVELSIEVARFGLDTRPGDLTHDGAQPDVATVHGACHVLTSALFVGWPQTHP